VCYILACVCLTRVADYPQRPTLTFGGVAMLAGCCLTALVVLAVQL